MRQADRIRRFVMDAYVLPARNAGVKEMELRAGDVHRDMGLANAMPAVCSALGSDRFELLCGAGLLARTGPSNGANARFRFAVAARPSVAPPAGPSRPAGKTPSPQGPVDFSDAVVLVSCVKSKLAREAAARDLYASSWFRHARRIVERSGARWYVLSALHGLVPPATVIAPYDLALNKLGTRKRHQWADDVFKALTRAEPDLRRVIMLAGQRYREFLAPKLQARGVTVDIPMRGLGLGGQLRWLGGYP